MKKIAVIGTGAIGCLLGACLSHAGQDVTMVSAFQPGRAEFLRENGLWMSGLGEGGDEFHTDVKAAYLPKLHGAPFDIALLAVKSNDLVAAVTAFAPHLAADGCAVTFENGINEEFLIPILGRERVVAGSSFAGGVVENGNHMHSHEGFFVVGELDGGVTPRTEELAGILRCCRPTEASANVRAYQWEKMGRVCLSVPCACVSGLFLGSVFLEPRLQKLFARLALEVMSVAQADGCPMDSLENKSRAQWEDVAAGRLTGLEGRTDDWPDGIVDAYTADIRRKRPLEIAYTNGAVSRLGRRCGVPTPANDCITALVLELERGTQTPGFHLVDRILAAT